MRRGKRDSGEMVGVGEMDVGSRAGGEGAGAGCCCWCCLKEAVEKNRKDNGGPSAMNVARRKTGPGEGKFLRIAVTIEGSWEPLSL